MRRKINMGNAKVEKTYTPAEVCEMFGIPRTTLFRWEELSSFPPPVRDEEKKSRVYREEDLKNIASLVRKKIREDINANSQYSAEREYPPRDLEEKLYRLEFIADKDKRTSLQMLSVLSERQILSSETMTMLQEELRKRPAGDPIRKRILELLLKQENTIASNK